MRLFCYLIFMLTSFLTQAQLNIDLQKELIGMQTKDQEIRELADQELRRMIGHEEENNLSVALQQEMLSIDQKNTRRLKEIIKQHGWPGKELVGETGITAIFLIVQHSPDSDFQASMLPLLTASFEKGEGITGQDVALLTDRVRVTKGQYQLYGTQLEIIQGKLVFLPIEDEDNVDFRRAKMDMMPLDEYRRLVEEHYQKTGH
ncbi:DUF6624 domain-containing protein [Hahella ganghwensis]|uniref:DUF6624 domain-containing protein n=1 Tax=Hahella ganghwensis TaxID=286420 RepID=UPI00036B114F|nr:DUF6624 domain-containing protein [Hahella ganghwensis]